jgi:hypothetical protein
MANVTLKPVAGRQTPLFAEIAFSFSNIADTGVPVTAVRLPTGAQVVSGAVVIDTAFNNGGAATINAGDAASGARYAGGVDLKTAGRTALTLTGFIGDGSDIVITPTLAGAAATQGSGRLLVSYVIAGRSTEVQPN